MYEDDELMKEAVLSFRNKYKDLMSDKIILTDDEIISHIKKSNIENRELEKEQEEIVEMFYRDTEGEDFLQIILRGHLYIEHEIVEIIKLHFKKSHIFLRDKPSFVTKLNLVCALDIIPEVNKGAYNQLNTIRNKYAHQLNYELKADSFNDFIKYFKKYELKNFKNDLEKEDIDLIDKMRSSISFLWSYTRLLHKKEKIKIQKESIKELTGKTKQKLKRLEEQDQEIKKLTRKKDLLLKDLEGKK